MTTTNNSNNPRDVETTLNYSKTLSTTDPSEHWFTSIVVSADGKLDRNFVEEAIPIIIHDIRGHESETHIDVTGFQAVHSPSKVGADLILNRTVEQVKEAYYAEVEELLKRVTGAKHIVCFNHIVRKVRPGQVADASSIPPPVQRVHVDQTPIIAHTQVKKYAADIQWKRFQLINVWRPLQNPVYDYPLAVADFRSIDVVNDLVPTTLVYPAPSSNGELYSVLYNPKHQWFYWSKMTPDEVLLLKCYDSTSRALSTVKESAAVVDETLLQDVAGSTPHAAFYDAQGAKEGPSRQSIEVRALVFYD